MDTNELSFVYFPENYRWSHGLLLALNGAPWGGGEIGEIHRIGLRLRARPGDDRAWVEEWTRMWIFGVKTREDALARLEGFRLDGVVQKIRCPFLLVHGEGDEQIPLATAQKCFDAVGSTRKTFKVFTRAEGGYHHCQIDNVSIGTAYMWDWLEDVLQPRRS